VKPAVLIATLVVALLLGLASSQGATPGGSARTLLAPVHQSHPMVPLTSTGGTSPLSSSISCPESSGQCLVDLNWAGYSVCGASQAVCAACLSGSSCPPTLGEVTHVKGTWTVPRITGSYGAHCSDSQNTWYDASDWVGIDGLFSASVEQTGTSSDCFYGQAQYYAWYEFYPSPSFTISSITVSPGDSMTATISCNDVAGAIGCTTTLTDNTNGGTFTASTNVPDNYCATTDTYCLNSAEWVQEDAYYDGFLALTPVTPVVFTDASATIGGATHQISGWGPQLYWLSTATFEYPYVSANQASSTLKSETSRLGFDGSFTIRFVSSGP
jgi:hypothetical protein